MSAFLSICVLMVLIAVAIVAWPLLRARREEPNAKVATRYLTVVILAVAVPAVAVGLYVKFSNWSWNGPPPQAGAPDVNAMVAQLEQRLKNNPQDDQGWLMLGRSYVALGRYALAVNAYQQAYDLSSGKNLEAITGLAEAMVLVDEASLTGKAGQLIDEALNLQPTNPKALWYGGLTALRAENLPLARERFQALLVQNPPQQIRAILEREVQDLDQQLNPAQSSGKTAGNNERRKLRVSVTLAPTIKQKLSEPMSLFILARTPGRGGPPLAVVKRSAAELPVTVELSEADAMLPTHSIANAPAVEIVARLSKSGNPIEQSGDYSGSADYSFAKQGPQGTVDIEIDRAVP